MIKLKPIKDLIKCAEKLSKDSKKNRSKLEKIRQQIINQKQTIDLIDLTKIKKKISNGNLDYSEYNRYKNILNEKKDYEKYSDTIQKIINRNYNVINSKRKIKKAKFCGVIATSVFVISLSSCTIDIIKNSSNNNIDNTEEATTEKEIFIIEDNDDEVDPYWGFGDSSVAFEEFDDIEATTEKNIEENTEENTTEEDIDPYWAFGDGTYAFEDKSIYWGFDNLNQNTVQNSINFFNTASGYIDDMEEIITDSDKREVVKEEAEKKAIKYIDFIFYDESINGVYFDDLKDDAKQKAYNNCQKLVTLVNNYDPNYFDNMGERYSRLKDLSNTTLDSAKNKIKDKVGEEYYNDAGNVKDDTIDSIKDTGKILKNIISDKYQSWKNSGN